MNRWKRGDLILGGNRILFVLGVIGEKLFYVEVGHYYREAAINNWNLTGVVQNMHYYHSDFTREAFLNTFDCSLEIKQSDLSKDSQEELNKFKKLYIESCIL